MVCPELSVLPVLPSLSCTLSYLPCMVCSILSVCFRLRCWSVLPVLYGLSYMVCLFQAAVLVCPTCLYGLSYMVCLFQAAVLVCPTCPVWSVLHGLSVSGCGVGLSCMVCPKWSVCFRLRCWSVLPVLHGLRAALLHQAAGACVWDHDDRFQHQHPSSSALHQVAAGHIRVARGIDDPRRYPHRGRLSIGPAAPPTLPNARPKPAANEAQGGSPGGAFVQTVV